MSKTTTAHNTRARAPRSRSYSRFREGASEMHVRSAGLFQWGDEDYNAATLSEFPRQCSTVWKMHRHRQGNIFPQALAQAGRHLRESPLRRGHARDPPAAAASCWRGLAPRLAHRAASTARWTDAVTVSRVSAVAGPNSMNEMGVASAGALHPTIIESSIGATD